METIPQETLEILSQMKSPTFRQSLNYALTYWHDDYTNHSHETWQEKVDVAGLEDFCKTLYLDWRKDLIDNFESLSEKEKEVAIRLRDYDQFQPENIAKLPLATPFYDFFARGFDKYFGSYAQPPSHLQNAEKSIVPDKDTIMPDGFLHVYGWAFKDLEKDKRDARLYLNLKSENIPTFVKEFYTICRQKKLPYYFKFAICDNRNDPFLIYTSYEKIPEYIEVIKEIKQKSPHLFVGTEQISQNFARIDEFIGYGDNPVEDHKFSYNSIRKNAINGVSQKLKKDRKEMFKVDNKNRNEIFTTKPNTMTLEDYCKYQLKQCINNGLLVGGKKDKVDENVFISQFMRSLKELVLQNKPIEDILDTQTGATLKISNIDWISVLAQGSGLAFENQTQARAFLTKHMVFSGVTLNANEAKLVRAVHTQLVKGLYADEQLVETDEEVKLLNRYKAKLAHPIANLDATGKALVLLAAANFIENGRLIVKLKNNQIAYDEQNLAVYEELFGKEDIDELIETTCKKQGISSDLLCFDRDTQEIFDNYIQQQEKAITI